MFERSFFDRFNIWWWSELEGDTDPNGALAKIMGWPVPIEINNVEVNDAGRA